ncbi:hypothetical protein VA596_49730 [Amycolatopsis sp., V23-08]|uniref:Protein kinase domain-containing protein n=1 Tax=Amycolatopsis heterodermiae TaxID=3110235 RepID=A0ABU5RMZ6_9PSEU|nr:hypothetical protein [Amycolatopsis sp., V23-08]MEA5367691.1 hypothetical protein [Amycolatopsis sp., V23-08]
MITTRLARHERIAAELSAPDLLASATPLGTGIGGTTWLLRVAGEPVFVKRIALTDVEQRHEGSTADLYGLPPWSHYGVGSAGGGAWRELAAHRDASEWVRTGACENFPLLHGWCVRPGLPRPATDLERDVAFWHGDPGVRRRLEALDASATDLVLFLEHLPKTLAEWPDAPLQQVDEELRHVTGFLATQDVQHFDAHFANIVTDGERLCLTDFGLTLSSRFELSDAEAEFLAEHATHDRGYVLTHLVNRIVRPLREWPHPRVRNDFVRACAEGRPVPELPPDAAALLRRYAPLATVVNDFYFALHGESRKTPYPADEIARLLASV